MGYDHDVVRLALLLLSLRLAVLQTVEGKSGCQHGPSEQCFASAESFGSWPRLQILLLTMSFSFSCLTTSVLLRAPPTLFGHNEIRDGRLMYRPAQHAALQADSAGNNLARKDAEPP